MEDARTFVGMDVHQSGIQIAIVRAGRSEVTELRIANERTVIRRLARKLLREGRGGVRFCYEAGPSGYGLQRQLGSEGVDCPIVGWFKPPASSRELGASGLVRFGG